MSSNQPDRSAGATRGRTVIVIASAAAVLAILALIVVVVMVKRSGHHTPNGPAAANSRSATTTSELPTGQPVTTPTAAPALQGVPGLPPFTPTGDLGNNCQYPRASEPASKPVAPPRAGKVPTNPPHVSVSVDTNAGGIGLQLANDESPCTVNSFVSLAQKGFFDNTPCHRLTTAPSLSVLQCGDPRGDGTGGPGYQFADEYPTDQYTPDDPARQRTVVYPRGTLAMANSGPNTNGSQFFLVYRDSELPPDYTVFGTIQQDGLATLDTIAKGGVAGGGEDGPPATEVTIKSVRLD